MGERSEVVAHRGGRQDKMDGHATRWTGLERRNQTPNTNPELDLWPRSVPPPPPHRRHRPILPQGRPPLLALLARHLTLACPMKLPPTHVHGSIPVNISKQKLTEPADATETKIPPHGETFGARLMSSLGWREGEGLGKNGQGRASAIKVKKREDNVGVGADAAYDWKDKWWENAFEQAARAIRVGNAEHRLDGDARRSESQEDASTSGDDDDDDEIDDDDNDEQEQLEVKGPPTGWWGERIFAFAGLLSLKRDGLKRPKKRRSRGFTEEDQEKLAANTAAHARGRGAGRGGLGRGGGESGAGELKAKEYAGQKMRFDDDNDDKGDVTRCNKRKRSSKDAEPTSTSASTMSSSQDKWRRAALDILTSSKKGHAAGKGVRIDWLEARLLKVAPTAAPSGDKLAKKMRKSHSFDVLDVDGEVRVRIGGR